jgi:alkanesulfonate monooxygenase SsuD/methylene tetrahydromethanopterin reductase-like flavin-dependent oxidoreductase (luciferase family)
MKFQLFMLPTAGPREVLERGMAGRSGEHYRRALDDIGRIARVADDAGYAGIGFTEHHFHIEGFEISTNPVLLDCYVAMQTRRLRVGQLGIVLPAASPLRVAEDIAMLDQISGGRAYAGFARGYQQRWVNTLGQHIHVGATRSDKGEMDAINRAAFEEALAIIKLAWTQDTFRYEGRFWTIPPPDTAWPMPATRRWGRGVDSADRLTEIGIVPRPVQQPHPPIYGPFAFSMSTVRYWAQVGGIPVLLSGDVDFCRGLFTEYREEAARHGRALRWGESIALGGFFAMAGNAAAAQSQAESYRWAHDAWFTPFGFPKGLELVGDPDSVSRQLETLHEALAFDEVFLWINQGLTGVGDVLRGLELFAERVMPRFA